MSENNNTHTTNGNTEATLRRCGAMTKRNERCKAQFRSDDSTITMCSNHRDSGQTPPVPEERAVALPIRNPDHITFAVNVGDNRLRGDKGALQALIVAFTEANTGFGQFNPDVFVAVEMGTNDSAVIMPNSAAQFVIMAATMCRAGWETEIRGTKHTVKISVVEDAQWAPVVIRDLCGACWGGTPSRACDLDKPNSIDEEQRYVVKVSVLAELNGIRLDEVTDDMLLESSLCSYHGRAVNQQASNMHKRRVEIFGPYSQEKAFLDRLHGNKANREQIVGEAASVMGGVEKIASLADVAIANADKRYGRKAKDGHGKRTHKGGGKERRHRDRE